MNKSKEANGGSSTEDKPRVSHEVAAPLHATEQNQREQLCNYHHFNTYNNSCSFRFPLFLH